MSDADSETRDSSTNPRHRESTNTNNPSGEANPARAEGRVASGMDAVVEHIANHRVDFILALTRALTVLCTISYLIGFPGPSDNRFKQALLMNAATSSLRLHQRTPPPALNQLSRNYFMSLIREDSFHYLMYPLMFFTGHPLLLALLPCCLYAIFNLAVYAITILDKLGNQEHLRNKLSGFIAQYQQSLLHTVALAELTLMPVIVLGVFLRYVGILVPVLYYRFLMLRYNSTRNAHMKLLVSQLMNFIRAQMARR